MSNVNFADLQGKMLKSVVVSDDKERIEFECADGRKFALYHSQDCCESVVVDDVSGDLADLIGTPILLAEEAVSDNPPEPPEGCTKFDNSNTWTFYKLRTIKGSADIRWHGSSNGYYSESVSFCEVV
jgi:hypothetical protein